MIRGAEQWLQSIKNGNFYIYVFIILSWLTLTDIIILGHYKYTDQMTKKANKQIVSSSNGLEENRQNLKLTTKAEDLQTKNEQQA